MDMVPLNTWDRLDGERAAHHAWLTAYCELGPTRTVDQVAARCGVSVQSVRRAAEQGDWKLRAGAYDRAAQHIGSSVVMDDAEALGTQYVVGAALVRLAVTGVKLKNPALLNMKQIHDLLSTGTEMMRRGAGVADIKVEHSTQDRVSRHIEGLLGLIEGEDAEGE